jgi:indole-3-glycerol phosphate synthase
VLTDEPYFQGQNADLIAARAASGLPTLRKDFMLTAYQIVESRVLGADCVLLIMACLTDVQAQELSKLAGELGMCRLLEVHDAAELDRALTIEGELLGINNRDLKTLVTDTATTERLLPRCPPDRMVISESGLKAHADLARLATVGVGGYLVGESLLKQPDLLVATRHLLGWNQPEATA